MVHQKFHDHPVECSRYSLKWNYLFNCTNGQFIGGFADSSSYDGSHMSSGDNSTGSFMIQAAPAAYTLNTTYNRTGSQTSKIGATMRFPVHSKLVGTDHHNTFDSNNV